MSAIQGSGLEVSTVLLLLRHCFDYICGIVHVVYPPYDGRHSPILVYM